VGLAESGACQEGTGTTLPAFEVVSVRKVDPQASPVGGTYTPTKACEYGAGGIRCQLSLWELIEQAYGLKKYELDGPAWLWDGAFSVQATMPAGTTKEVARMMLQRALAERFGLKVHCEARERSVYFLVPAKKGIKLQPIIGDFSQQKRRTYQGGNGSFKAQSYMTRGEYFSSATDMDTFAGNMANFVDLETPILNKTGLTGMYKVDLHWTPGETTEHEGTMRDPAFADVVERQLGLRLAKGMAVFQMVVVDHAERMPTEN